MMTALRADTFENLQLNAGVFLIGIDASTYTDADALEEAVFAALEDETKHLGATIGDGTFVAEPEVRNIEANGKRYDVIGSTVFDSWSCRMTGTMKEITPGNFARALATADVTKNGSVTKVTIRTNVKPTDYIPKLCWVGDTSKGLMMIELDNALNINGATFTFTDKGEGSIPFEFKAHVDDLKKQDEAPARLYFFDKAA
jgi:hypothetical protein